jgi:hypothetical protein
MVGYSLKCRLRDVVFAMPIQRFLRPLYLIGDPAPLLWRPMSPILIYTLPYIQPPRAPLFIWQVPIPETEGTFFGSGRRKWAIQTRSRL